MRPTTAPTIQLSDYTEPSFWIDTVDLSFKLAPKATRVTSTIVFKPNRSRTDGPHDLRLDGRGLTLISAMIDDRELPKDAVLLDAEGLTIPHDLVPQDGFTWSAVVEINPKDNTALEGLYMSNGMYCTQCEAQGFRKITYYPDRPDVMATFTVNIEGSEPVLLSNGNKVSHGHWHDPWPKPAYLFALVAGDLVSYDDTFTTQSGRHVDLQIFVRDGDQDKCEYAMDALKRSMTWDEQVYGREYDLDLFMIVAVDDFNMGAMENKGLNIFNSKYVLASPQTATDGDFERIEGIIAHEYFHNWTGNRITCRDWFQLCLKEGLTVFRDQQFSGDMRSHAVKRIDDVSMLRGRQFREDAGPLAHPVRPEEYIEINNFYTATVYEKGAEVIGMLKLLVGDAAYDTALDLYFDRHDGQACTIEDWLQVFEDVTGRDLSQFALWYSQSGTPHLDVTDAYENGTYTLTFKQSNPPTPGQSDKKPQVIPMRLGLLDKTGKQVIDEQLVEVTKDTQTISFDNLSAKPIPSLLRGFSAPVILNYDMDNKTRAFLLANDSDPYNRWEAGFTFATDLLCTMASNDAPVDPAYSAAVKILATDDSLDPAFRTFALGMPTEDAIAQAIYDRGTVPDPQKIYQARQALTLDMAQTMSDILPNLYQTMKVTGAYSPDATAAGKRALRIRALNLLTKLDDHATLAKEQYAGADNMTEKLSALAVLIGADQGQDAIADFYKTWSHDKLVMDKWFAIQPSASTPDQALKVTKTLADHPDFNWKNPNRFRSLIGPFAMNPAAFHSDGGYDFVADWLIKLDAVNPQTTARMCGVFETWKRYDETRQSQMRTAMTRIADAQNLSKDTSEIIGKMLG